MSEEQRPLPRLELNASVSFRVSQEMKEEFERVARQVMMTSPDAARLAIWEFVLKYEGRQERPEF